MVVTEKQRAEMYAKMLKQEYPNPKTELNHKNEMQLAVAVALSAQTTDKKVNQVTKGLFKKYKTWEDFANADLEELKNDIYGVNFHKGKADRLIKAGRIMVAEFNGKLPKTIVGLAKIPGVARKTANVIMQELWDEAEGIVVDTHVTRVSNRLELTSEKNAVKIEKNLMKLIPKIYWRNFSGAVVLHGRYVCTARRPKCSKCFLSEVCPSAFKFE